MWWGAHVRLDPLADGGSVRLDRFADDLGVRGERLNAIYHCFQHEQLAEQYNKGVFLPMGFLEVRLDFRWFCGVLCPLRRQQQQHSTTSARAL